MDINHLLSLPESKTLEFKRDLSSLKPIIKTIVAFANTAGGVMIIGRNSEGGIIGIDDVLTAEEKLANCFADSISPSLIPDIEVTTVSSKSIIIIKVSHQQGPFFVKQEGDIDGVYIRLGSTSRRAAPEILAELRRSQLGISFDQMPCANLSQLSLDQKRIEDFFQFIGKKNEKRFLETLGIIIPTAGNFSVSNGGLILFGNDESRGKYFPHTQLICARFKGTNKSTFIDRQEINGTIIEAADQVIKFIHRNTKLSSDISSLRRQDISEYPGIAIREVLINALAHADYSLGGRIKLAIYDDRLEVENPGMLPFGLTLEDFKSGISRVRNRVIARVFRELNLMEEWGSGYVRSVSYCKEHEYPEPEWEEIGSSIRVTFRPHPYFESYGQNDVPINVPVNVPVNATLNERQLWFINELSQGKKLRSPDIARHWKVSEKTAKRDISQLQEHKIIEFKGSPKKGHYGLL